MEHGLVQRRVPLEAGPRGLGVGLGSSHGPDDTPSSRRAASSTSRRGGGQSPRLRGRSGPKAAGTVRASGSGQPRAAVGVEPARQPRPAQRSAAGGGAQQRDEARPRAAAPAAPPSGRARARFRLRSIWWRPVAPQADRMSLPVCPQARRFVRMIGAKPPRPSAAHYSGLRIGTLGGRQAPPCEAGSADGTARARVRVRSSAAVPAAEHAQGGGEGGGECGGPPLRAVGLPLRAVSLPLRAVGPPLRAVGPPLRAGPVVGTGAGSALNARPELLPWPRASLKPRRRARNVAFAPSPLGDEQATWLGLRQRAAAAAPPVDCSKAPWLGLGFPSHALRPVTMEPVGTRL
eukprot:scaffold97652_cov66-Phaeocystis_antarctica.AAC.5